jgi:2-hydroxy-3-keto-5-methylthiopentenyl-1-phosphate phosphatase
VVRRAGRGEGSEDRRRGSSRGHEPLLSVSLVLDFDGTITEEDLLHLVATTFGDEAVYQEVEDGLQKGRLTLREVISREFAPVTEPLETVVAWTLENARVRAGFRELVEEAQARGRQVLVVSSGFHELIEPVLAREGVEVELHANRLDPRPDGWVVLWNYDEECEACGESCKRSMVGQLARGEEVVYIGDGYSDRCAAEAADRVFAIKGLARYLDEHGIKYEPFEDFHDVAAALR